MIKVVETFIPNALEPMVVSSAWIESKNDLWFLGRTLLNLSNHSIQALYNSGALSIIYPDGVAMVELFENPRPILVS